MTTFVMDSSAALAILLGEAGSEAAIALLPNSRCSTVNATEIITRLIDKGRSQERAAEDFYSLGMTVVDFDEALSVHAGYLRPATRHKGLSLGDRACLAVAIRDNATAVTADRSWADLEVGCKIEVIR